MNRIFRNLIILIAAISTMPAMAQTFTIGEADVLAGDTGVVIPILFTAGSDVGGIDVDITFTDAQYTSVSIDCDIDEPEGVGIDFDFCGTDPGVAHVTLSCEFGVPCTSGTIANLTFDISGSAAVGVDPLAGTIVGLADSMGVDFMDPDSVMPITDGSITVLGPVYESSPPPGALPTLSQAMGFQPDPSTVLSIDNTGAPGSVVTGECTVPAGVFSVTNGAYAIGESDAPHQVTVTCESDSAVNTYNETMTCTNPNGTDPSDRLYDLTCNITPTPPAVFRSVPAPGSTIDITDGTPVPEGTDTAPEPLDFFNDGISGAEDLQVRCDLIGPPQITVTPDISGGITIAPGGSSGVTFDCSTSPVGNYQATYACEYDLGIFIPPVPGNGFVVDGTADYTVTCDVRGAISEVQPTVPNGTTLDFGLIQPGATTDQMSVGFDEVLGENPMPNDAILGNCFIDGPNAGSFNIVSPPAFPVFLDATDPGTIQLVTVEGTDDSDLDLYSATLTCEYGDSANPCPDLGGADPGTDGGIIGCPNTVSYPLTFTVGGDATFTVTKNFTDGDHDTPVEVTLDCFQGLPITQTQTVTESQEVTFTVQNFESGELVCEVSEDPVPNGYSASYNAFSAEIDQSVATGGPDSCHFADVTGGSDHFCEITNDADEVDIEIEKEWIIEGNGASAISQDFTLILYCDAQITGGYGYCAGGFEIRGDYESCIELNGNGNDDFTVKVTPNYPSSDCWVDEITYSDAIVTSNGCGDLEISAGEGDSCLITNTLFFEGIPTLSQYGLAILALLMLSVGMVGFRRFV